MANPHPAPGPGRPKGSQNKISSEVVADLFAVYKKKHRQKWLMNLTDDQFLKLFSKIVPQTQVIEGNFDAPITVVIKKLGEK